MSNQAKTVLWIGLILIVVQLVQQWKTIKAIIFTPSTPIASSGGGGGLLNPFVGLPVPGLSIPGVTKNPGATFPKINLAPGTGLGGNRVP